MANRSKVYLDKSNASSVNGEEVNRDLEYFWSVKLSAEQRSATWVINNKSTEDDDEDQVLDHTLFVKSVVLGGNAVSGEQNIVVLQSSGQDGKTQKAAIANLTRGLNPMSPLDLSIPGKIGGTFTLSAGSGPVTISGNVLLEYPGDDDALDYTQAEGDYTVDEEEEDENDAEEDDESEEEMVKSKKGSKRKASTTITKHKQKAKIDVDDDEQEEEEEDDEDDEDDEDYELPKTKKTKAGKGTPKPDRGKAKTVKDSGKKVANAVRK